MGFCWGMLSGVCALDIRKPASLESLLSHLLEKLATPRRLHVGQCNEELLTRAFLLCLLPLCTALDMWPLSG